MAFVLTGCATTQLAFTTSRQIKTEPDIYNQEVLENLSRIATIPSSMAYFATLDSGVPTDTDIGSLGMFLNFPAQTVVKQLHRQRGGQLGPLNGERDVQATWNLKPVNDPDRLEAMRLLYLWALGQLGTEQANANIELMSKFFAKRFEWSDYDRGWFMTGCWHDVPRDARYVLHHHGTYCWVAPGMEAQVTKLSLAMLDIATVSPPTMQVVYDDKWHATQMTRVLPDQTPSQAAAYAVRQAQERQLGAEALPRALQVLPPAILRNDTKIQLSPGYFFTPR